MPVITSLVLSRKEGDLSSTPPPFFPSSFFLPAQQSSLCFLKFLGWGLGSGTATYYPKALNF